MCLAWETLSKLFGSPIAHKLLSGLLSHFNHILLMCQPPFLCFNSFTPSVIFNVHWMDGKTKAQRCEVTCSGDTAGRQHLGLTDSMSSVPFVAQQRLPLDVRAEGPELR